jgi:hypothetical protein
VTLVATVSNVGAEPVSGLVSTSAGERAFTAPGSGKTATLAFSTRLTSVDPGSITVTITGSPTAIEAEYAAKECS